MIREHATRGSAHDAGISCSISAGDGETCLTPTAAVLLQFRRGDGVLDACFFCQFDVFLFFVFFSYVAGDTILLRQDNDFHEKRRG